MPPSRSDGPGRPRRRRGVLRHYDRPFFRDRLFWLVGIPSVVVTALIVGVLLVVWGVPDGVWGWVRLVLIGIIVLNVAFRLLGAGVTSTRHFQRGLGEGSRQREGDLEAKGRAAGAVVGKALRTARATRGATPSSAPPTSTAPTGAATVSPPSIPAPPAPDSSPPPPTLTPDHAPAQDLGDDAERPAPAADGEPDRAGHAGAAGGGPETSTAEGGGGPVTDTGSELATEDEGARGVADGDAQRPAPQGDDEPAPTALGDEAAPTPASTPDRPPITADKAARVAGAMVGRRLAERRRRQR